MLGKDNFYDRSTESHSEKEREREMKANETDATIIGAVVDFDNRKFVFAFLFCVFFLCSLKRHKCQMPNANAAL